MIFSRFSLFLLSSSSPAKLDRSELRREWNFVIDAKTSFPINHEKRETDSTVPIFVQKKKKGKKTKRNKTPSVSSVWSASNHSGNVQRGGQAKKVCDSHGIEWPLPCSVVRWMQMNGRQRPLYSTTIPHSETREDLDVGTIRADLTACHTTKKKKNKKKVARGQPRGLHNWTRRTIILATLDNGVSSEGKVLSWAGRVTRLHVQLTPCPSPSSSFPVSVNLVKYFSVLVSLFSRASGREPFNYHHHQAVRRGVKRNGSFTTDPVTPDPTVLSCVRYPVYKRRKTMLYAYIEYNTWSVWSGEKKRRKEKGTLILRLMH